MLRWIASAALATVLAAASPRLDDEADRQAFRGWFAFLAESLFYRPPQQLLPEINDCAALVRFAYREALREHDGRWAGELGLQIIPPLAPVRQYRYPSAPLGVNLFRVSGDGFAQFADARSLWRYNAHFVTRTLRRAVRGDLLFYRQLDQNLPFHVMVFLGPSQFEPGPRQFVVYHTGPLGGGKGEVRRLSVEELLGHPLPKWRPREGNANFLGVYRWNLLRNSD